MTVATAAPHPIADAFRGYAASALAGRVLLSVIFLLSGASKLGAPDATIAKIDAAGLPFASLGLAIALLVELAGGTALIVGYRTRTAAMALALYSMATALAFHSHLGDPNQFIHFFKNIALAGGFLQVVAYGGGRYSLDARKRLAAPGGQNHRR